MTPELPFGQDGRLRLKPVDSSPAKENSNSFQVNGRLRFGQIKICDLIDNNWDKIFGNDKFRDQYLILLAPNEAISCLRVDLTAKPYTDGKMCVFEGTVFSVDKGANFSFVADVAPDCFKLLKPGSSVKLTIPDSKSKLVTISF